MSLGEIIDGWFPAGNGITHNITIDDKTKSFIISIVAVWFVYVVIKTALK